MFDPVSVYIVLSMVVVTTVVGSYLLVLSLYFSECDRSPFVNEQ
jgi:hypothetical protein